jgi:hypothetical protein
MIIRYKEPMEIDSENAQSENYTCSKPKKAKRSPDLGRKRTFKSLKKNFNLEDDLIDSADCSPRVIRKPFQARRLFDITTPHNTTQYLTANHCRGTSDYPINISYNMFTDEEFKKLIANDIITIDDLCITGGSMKGIIATNTCRSDVCNRQVNGLLDIINTQKMVIENLKEQIQNVQRST